MMQWRLIMNKLFIICLMGIVGLSAGAQAETIKNAGQAKPDLTKENILYVVGYAHLDTQWRWGYQTAIDEFLEKTLDDNFYLFEKYPDYVFNFTGSNRYAMFKEYYPEKYQKLKEYIAKGRWFVSGSSVDEGDVLNVSPESVIRQVLYGNEFFRNEFGKESCDYMLPDCFGFPARMPSIWAHCGLLGFSWMVGHILQGTGVYDKILLICGSAYVIAWLIFHLVVPKIRPIEIK